MSEDNRLEPVDRARLLMLWRDGNVQEGLIKTLLGVQNNHEIGYLYEAEIAEAQRAAGLRE